MAAKPCYSQEENNDAEANFLRSLDFSESTSRRVVLSKPMQPVENTSVLELSVVISQSGVEYKGSSEDSICSRGTQEELSMLSLLFHNLYIRYIRMSSSREPILPVNLLREALDAEGRKLPVKLLRKYVRCLYYEVTKLSNSKARVKTSRICMWSDRPADWPAHIPFQDPNNSVQSKRPSKRDLQAMFDHLTSKYKKLKANQLSIEESSDELPGFDEDFLRELSVLPEGEGFELTDIQCKELGFTLQEQLQSTSYSTPKPEIPMEKPSSVPSEKFISYSNTHSNLRRIDTTELCARKIIAMAIEACDEIQQKT